MSAHCGEWFDWLLAAFMKSDLCICSQLSVDSVVYCFSFLVIVFAVYIFVMDFVSANEYSKLFYRRRTARRAVSQNLVNCTNSKLYHKFTDDTSFGPPRPRQRVLAVRRTSGRSSYCQQKPWPQYSRSRTEWRSVTLFCCPTLYRPMPELRLCFVSASEVTIA